MWRPLPPTSPPDEGVDRLYRRVQEMDRPLEAVALNAGVGEGGAFLDNPLEKEMRLIRLNVLSTVPPGQAM